MQQQQENKKCTFYALFRCENGQNNKTLAQTHTYEHICGTLIMLLLMGQNIKRQQPSLPITGWWPAALRENVNWPLVLE